MERIWVDMKLIALSRGMVAKVDDEDFEFLSQWKWRAKKKKHSKHYYAIRYKYAPVNRQKLVSMARLIMGEPDGVLVDHWNGDTLDNQKRNLRLATNAQNQHNQRLLRVDNTTGFKGVTFFKAKGKYNAQIYVNKIRKNLGYFATAQQAAMAYDAAALKYFGEFAAPNAVIQ